MISRIPRFVLAALLFVFAAALTGCEYEEAEVPVAEYGYQPVYYNGYMVYYDTAGLPYYYMDGGMYYVPRSYGYYDTLVDHYRVYRPHYHRWYVSGGYRYQTYHSAAPTHVYTAPPARRVYRPAVPSPRNYAPAPAPRRYTPAPAPRSAPRAVPRRNSGGGHVHVGGRGRGGRR